MGRMGNGPEGSRPRQVRRSAMVPAPRGHDNSGEGPIPAMDTDAVTRAMALVEQAGRGDDGAMQALRPLLARTPGWEQDVTGPATHARRLLLEATMGDNLFVRAAWESRACALQRELEGPTPTPLERAMCERIATC